MEGYTMENGLWVRSMDKELCLFQMETNMKENGKMTLKKDLDSSNMQKEICMKVNGIMIK